MDNLRLEPVSAHAAAGGHHLLSFAVPSSIEFSSKSTINGVSQHCNSSLPPSLASLWTESQCVQNPNELLKAGMQSPDRGVEGTRSWDMSVNSVLQPKLGRPVSIAPVFAQTNVSVGSSMEALRANGPTLHLNHGSSPSASSFEHFSEAMDASGTDNSDNLHMCSPFTVLRENNAPISSDFRKDNAHTLPGFLASMEKVSSLPDAVVSALQPVPFSTKTETMTPQSQSFMSFTWDDKDGSKVRKEWISAVKEEVTVGGSVAMMAGLKTEQSNHALAGEVKELTMKREEEGVTIASLEDGSIGLRLGKRTYYGEVGGAEEFRGRVSNSRTLAGSCKDGIIKSSVNVSCAATADTTAPAAISATAAGTVSAAAITISTTTNNMSSSVGNNTGSSSSNTALVATVSSTLACSTSPATISVGNNGNHLPSTNNNNTKISSGGITNKKQKGSSASITVPSCQAEGCTADLSEAKEYHRRHKVCEWHSKASRAKVNNLEQRFCQQCSRFHVLSAFDEGKRSCRRRLAGHNERRRKPPPEPMPFLSPAGFTYFADGRVNAALHEHPYFLQHRPASLVSVDNSVLASQLGLAGFPQREAMSNYHALEFHRFMRGLSPMVGSGVGVLDGTGALMAANGSALALSSVLSSQTTPSSSSSVSLLPHVSSEMAISGRALSLLSSSLGSPETMSISLGMTSPSIDQYLPDNHPLSSSSRHQAPVDSTSCFNSAMGMPSSALHGLQRNHINSLNSITSSSSGCSVEMDQGRPPSISSFEGRSLILTKADGAFQNLQDGVNCNQGRPVLDLMHISPAESHHHQQQQQQHSQAELSYAYLQGFSIFNKENVI